ncbi:peptidoglycan-binding domain-containing protein [Alkalisalibacterium limincola]|uniref:peptidoglycan-binding domain-containing protein n=1 Tax=Alkalisalibacterium limincola TaxID=2699169 RepID=UPI001C9CC53B|nr:peptidoglycan-binding domain-containing protein [Alkalisalibacterium limincola]
MTFRNFDAIFSYNPSVNYALAIALLSDQIAGGPGIQAAWPTDDPPISRVQRRELQQLLLDRGHDIGAVDGIIGARSREAVKLEQERLGHEVSGRAGMKILDALRLEPAAAHEDPAIEEAPEGRSPAGGAAHGN